MLFLLPRTHKHHRRMFCLYRMSEAANHTLMTRSLCKRNSTGSRNGKPWVREFIYAQKSLFPQNKNYLTTTLIRFSSWLSSQSSFHQFRHAGPCRTARNAGKRSQPVTPAFNEVGPVRHWLPGPDIGTGSFHYHKIYSGFGAVGNFQIITLNGCGNPSGENKRFFFTG